MPRAKTGHRLPCGGYLALPTRILRTPSHAEMKEGVRLAATRRLRVWPAQPALEWFFATTELGIGTPVSQWKMERYGCGSHELQPGFSTWLTIQDCLANLSDRQLEMVVRRWADTGAVTTTDKLPDYLGAMVTLHDFPPLDDRSAKASMVNQGVIPIRDWNKLPNGAMIEPMKLWLLRKTLVVLDPIPKTC